MKRFPNRCICDKIKYKASVSPFVIFLQTNYTSWRVFLLYFFTYTAMNATDEMSALNRDMKAFFDANGAEYPVWQELEADCNGYLK